MKYLFFIPPTVAGMGNLCSAGSTNSSSGQASPKFAPRANGQVASEPVVAKTTHPRPAFHSNSNSGTTVVNGPSPNKQSGSTLPSHQSSVITIRTVSSSSKVTPSATVNTNGTTRSGADKRDSINNVEHHDVENDNSDDCQYSFPPVLEDFNLMDCDVDPSVLEDLFADDK